MKLPQVYPFVARIITPDVLTVGPLDAVGVTVHYTAGPTVAAAHASLAAKHLGYHLVIDLDGSVTQMAYLDRRVHHAGNAAWRGHAPNRAHVSVALVSWGLVTRAPGGDYATWNGQPLPASAVRTAGGHHWHAATPAQEARLVEVLRWLVAQGIAPADVCGHHECCLPLGRKVDPGGTLSMTMEALRHALAAPS